MDGIVKVIWQQKDCDIEAGHKSRCNHNSQACEAAFADYDNLGSTCFTAEAGFGTSLFKLPQILGLNKSGFRERDMLILKIVQASMKKVQSSKV